MQSLIISSPVFRSTSRALQTSTNMPTLLASLGPEDEALRVLVYLLKLCTVPSFPCCADEHYVPTLLASLGLETETYCRGWGLAYTDWSDNWIHPKSFK